MEDVYRKTTGGVTITVQPIYLDHYSDPGSHEYVWAYHVDIANDGDHPVTLQSRYWKIIDGFGKEYEVRGEGVVGKQPVIKPGERFEYSSGTPLPTPSGIMTGQYFMRGVAGDDFAVDIPTFSLDSPHSGSTSIN